MEMKQNGFFSRRNAAAKRAIALNNEIEIYIDIKKNLKRNPIGAKGI